MEEKEKHIGKKEEAKHGIKINKNLLVILITIIILILISVFAYHLVNPLPKQADLVYNNFEFYHVNGSWFTKWQNNGQVYDISLRFSPLEVENVSVSGYGLNNTFLSQPFYITFDPDENTSDFKYLALGVGELGLNIVRGMGAQMQMACTKNITEACADHPIVTCADDKSVWYVKTGPAPKVFLGGNCLTLEGKELDLIKAIDRVLYHFYKIMP